MTKTLPLHCISTAFVGYTLPLPRVSTAFAAKAPPSPCGPQVSSSVQIGDHGDAISTDELADLCTMSVHAINNLCCGGSGCVASDAYPTACSDGCAAVWTPLYSVCTGWVPLFGSNAAAFNEVCDRSEVTQ